MKQAYRFPIHLRLDEVLIVVDTSDFRVSITELGTIIQVGGSDDDSTVVDDHELRVDVSFFGDISVPFRLFVSRPSFVEQASSSSLSVMSDRITDLLVDIVGLLESLDNLFCFFVGCREWEFDVLSDFVFRVASESGLFSSFLRYGDQNVPVLAKFIFSRVATELKPGAQCRRKQLAEEGGYHRYR